MIAGKVTVRVLLMLVLIIVCISLIKDFIRFIM